MSLDSWIGKGKSYEDAPLNIANEVTARVALSADSLQELLPGLKTIAQVVEFPLPAQSHTTTLFKFESRFSKSPPNITLTALLKRDDWLVPALSTVEGLDHCVGQAVLDGHLSIALWGFADELYAPLNVLALWKFLSRAATAQVAWKKAFNWFNRTAGIEPEVTARVSAILQNASWDATIPALGDSLSVTDASQFLADGYLNTSHINVMLYRLQDLIVEQGRRNDEAVLVASVDLSMNLSQTKYPQGAQFETKTFGAYLACPGCPR